MLKSFMATTALVLVANGALADAHAANPMVGGAEMFPTMNIVENAVNSAFTPRWSPP